MKGFDEVMDKYPQYAEEIARAFSTVLNDPYERDIEAELYGLDIEEEDIFKLVNDIVEMRFG